MHREGARGTLPALATGRHRLRGRGSEETLRENHNIPIKHPNETLFFFQAPAGPAPFLFFTRLFAIIPPSDGDSLLLKL